MRFLCSKCDWTTEVELTVAPHPYLKDFTINLNEGARQRLGEHMEQHEDWPMFPQLGETKPSQPPREDRSTCAWWCHQYTHCECGGNAPEEDR